MRVPKRFRALQATPRDAVPCVFHESAHAVVAQALGVPVTAVRVFRVIPFRGEPGYWGEVELTSTDPTPQRLVVALTGVVAEVALYGGHDDGLYRTLRGNLRDDMVP